MKYIKIKFESNISLHHCLKSSLGLASAAQLVGRGAMNWKVEGSIPGQGTRLSCGFGPWLWHMQEGTGSIFLSHISVYLPLFLPSFPSL